MKCTECEREPPDKALYACDICKNQYCAECSGISPTEIRVLQLKNGRTLKFMCKVCNLLPGLDSRLKSIEMNLMNEIRQLGDIINCQDKKLIDQTVLINRLTTEINEMKTKTGNDNICLELKAIKAKLNNNRMENEPSTTKSYSKIVSGEAVVIKPKILQESSKTKEVLLKTLNPSEMEVGITQVKTAKDGGIILKCTTKEGTEKIRKEAEKRLGQQYEINTPKQKNPCVKIVDFEENISKDELIRCLKKQNAYLKNDEVKLEVIVIKKMKTRYMAILECDPKSHTRLLEEKTVCIGWTPSCRVFDYVRMLRCFKCGGYNHKADTCKQNDVCINCAEGGHCKENCKCTNYKCLNCIIANKNNNCNFDTNHSIYDVEKCQVYRKIFDIQKQKIRYESA